MWEILPVFDSPLICPMEAYFFHHNLTLFHSPAYSSLLLIPSSALLISVRVLHFLLVLFHVFYLIVEGLTKILHPLSQVQ